MSSHVLHWLPTLFFSCGFLPPSSHYRPALPFKLLVNNAISPFNHSTRFTAPYFRSTCSATSESHLPTRITALHCAQTAQQLRDFTFQLALLPCFTLQVVLQHWNFTTNLALPPRITTPHFRSSCSATSESHLPTRITASFISIQSAFHSSLAPRTFLAQRMPFK